MDDKRGKEKRASTISSTITFASMLFSDDNLKVAATGYYAKYVASPNMRMYAI